MSTDYYTLREGIHNLQRIDQGRVVQAPAWVATDVDGRVLAIVHEDCLGWLADRGIRIARRCNGVISVSGAGLDDEVVLSEYGEPVTLGELRRGDDGASGFPVCPCGSGRGAAGCCRG